MNSNPRSGPGNYYNRAREFPKEPLDDRYAAMRYIYSNMPDPHSVRKFSSAFPLRARRVMDIRVGALRTSRIPLPIGPAVVWMIQRMAVAAERHLHILTTGSSDASLETYALVYSDRAVEITSWIPKVHSRRLDLVKGLRPNATAKLTADHRAFLDLFPDESALIDMADVQSWSLETGNLLGLYLLEEFNMADGLLDGRINTSRLWRLVDRVGWAKLLQSIQNRVSAWHGIPEVAQLRIIAGAWDSPNQLLEGIKAALGGTHPEVPRPDLLFHDTATTPIPPPVMAEVIHACGTSARFLGIVRGIDALDQLKEACKAARVPLHVLQEAEAYRPRSVGFMFLVGNWPFARKYRRLRSKTAVKHIFRRPNPC